MKDFSAYALSIGSTLIVALISAYILDAEITWLSILGLMIFPGLFVTFMGFFTINKVMQDRATETIKDWGKTILQIGGLIFVVFVIAGISGKN